MNFSRINSLAIYQSYYASRVRGENCNVRQRLFGSFIWRCKNETQRCYHTSKTRRQQESQTGSSDVIVEVEGGVRKIIFNRPDKKNAMTSDMLKRILVGLQDSNEDENTTVIALKGSGNYFTSGLDMTPKPKEEKPAKAKKKGAEFATFVSAFLECKKPIIALVNGPSIGFGVTMLGLCDACYASDSATFLTTFTRFGLPPEFGSTYTFPRTMGYVKASNLLIFNQKMNAREAFKAGLISRVIPNSQFEEETKNLLNIYGQLPVKSLIYSKELVRGRERQLLYKVSEKEQSYFDPELARKVIMQFMAKKKKNSSE